MKLLHALDAVDRAAASCAAGVLLFVAAQSALAADAVPKPEPRPEPKPAPVAAPAPDVEKRLNDARQRLEQAAREVAQLSMQMGGEDVMRFRAGGERRAMLGVQLGESRGQGGVRVAGLSPGGPAAAAGLKPGDVIVSVNGRKVASARDVAERVHELPVGSGAKVDVERDGRTQTFVVVTRAMEPQIVLSRRLRGPDDADFAALADLPDLPDVGSGPIRMAFERVRPWSDLELATVTKDLGRYFGAERGVLVVKAPSNGALKLRDGDVITAIDGREPENGAHALRILRSYQPGERISLAVLRDRKAQKLDVALPEAGRGPLQAPRAPVSPPAPPSPAAPPSAPAAADAD